MSRAPVSAQRWLSGDRGLTLVAERTVAATAELEDVAASKCLRPQRIDGQFAGRCGRCVVCRAHDRMLAHLDFLRWGHHRNRWPGDKAEDAPDEEVC